MVEKQILSVLSKVRKYAPSVGVGALLLVSGVGHYAQNNTNNDLTQSLSLTQSALVDYQNQLATLQSELSRTNEALDLTSSRVDELNSANEVLQAEVTVKETVILNYSQELEEAKKEVKPVLLSLYEEDGLYHGNTLNLTIDDGEVNKLFDGEIKFDGEDYEVEEVVELVGSRIAYSAHPDFYREYGESARLELNGKKQVVYKVKISTDLNRSEVSNDEELVLPFLGQQLEIHELGTNYLVVSSGKKLSLEKGEEEEGLKLKVVGETSVLLEHEGKSYKVNKGSSAEVGDKEVYLEEAYPDEQIALLEVGSNVKQKHYDGDSFELFDQPKDQKRSEAEYVWVVDSEGVGVAHNQELYDEEALKVGQKLVLPNKYLTLSLQYADEPDYSEYEFSFGRVSINSTPTDVLKLSSSSSNGLEHDNDNSDEVVYDGNKFYSFNELLSDYEQVSSVSLKPSKLQLAEGSNSVSFDSFEFSFDLGEREFTALNYSGTTLDGRDEDVLSERGTVLSAPSDLETLRKLKFKVSEDKVEYSLKFE